jgi:hypothetical protein
MRLCNIHAARVWSGSVGPGMNSTLDLPSASHPRLGGMPRRVHGSALGALFVVILVLVWVTSAFRGQHVWAGWEESRGLRHPNYAETIHPDEIFRTSANTWSNLAYVLVGFYAFALARWDWRRRPAPEDGYLVRTPALSVLFGLACCALGAGSGLFHASLTRLGQQLDVAAMYPPVLVVIAVSVGRRWPRVGGDGSARSIPTWPLLAGIIAVGSWLLFRYKWSMSALVVLTTVILALTFVSLLDRYQAGRKLDGRWLWLAAGVLVAAVACRQLDVAGRFSGPDAWYQGHAVWHLLTAASLASIYGFYRSERVFGEPGQGEISS